MKLLASYFDPAMLFLDILIFCFTTSHHTPLTASSFFTFDVSRQEQAPVRGRTCARYCHFGCVSVWKSVSHCRKEELWVADMEGKTAEIILHYSCLFFFSVSRCGSVTHLYRKGVFFATVAKLCFRSSIFRSFRVEDGLLRHKFHRRERKSRKAGFNLLAQCEWSAHTSHHTSTCPTRAWTGRLAAAHGTLTRQLLVRHSSVRP